MPAVVHTTVLFKVLCYKIKNVFFIFVLVFYVHIVCVKSILNLLQYSTDCVSWVPRLTSLDL